MKLSKQENNTSSKKSLSARSGKSVRSRSGSQTSIKSSTQSKQSYAAHLREQMYVHHIQHLKQAKPVVNSFAFPQRELRSLLRCAKDLKKDDLRLQKKERTLRARRREEVDRAITSVSCNNYNDENTVLIKKLPPVKHNHKKQTKKEMFDEQRILADNILILRRLHDIQNRPLPMTTFRQPHPFQRKPLYSSSELDMSTHRKDYEKYMLTRVDLPKLRVGIQPSRDHSNSTSTIAKSSKGRTAHFIPNSSNHSVNRQSGRRGDRLNRTVDGYR